jgi:hypothetical protein
MDSTPLNSNTVSQHTLSFSLPSLLFTFLPPYLALCTLIHYLMCAHYAPSLSFFHSHPLTHSLTLIIPPSFNAYIGRRIDEMKALSDPMEARQSEEAQRGAFIPFDLHIAAMGYAALYCIPPVLPSLSHVSCLTSLILPLLSSLLSYPTSPLLSPHLPYITQATCLRS